MFELKKYKVIKSFNGYPVGITVAFNSKDAKIFAANIVEEKADVKQETPAEEKEVKKIKKGRK